MTKGRDFKKLVRARMARTGERYAAARAQLADRPDERSAKPVPRAVGPAIELHSAKFTRRLTTQWFAERVVARHRTCLARGGRPA